MVDEDTMANDDPKVVVATSVREHSCKVYSTLGLKSLL